MVLVPVLLALLAAGSSQQTTSSPIASIKNEKLADVLARFELVGESPRESPALRVRLLAVPDLGECSGSAESCPKVVLYIVVSNFDLLQDVSLYSVPNRYGWKLLSWEHLPGTEGPNEYVVFRVEADEPSPHPDKGLWQQ